MENTLHFSWHIVDISSAVGPAVAGDAAQFLPSQHSVPSHCLVEMGQSVFIPQKMAKGTYKYEHFSPGQQVTKHL